MKKTNNYWVPLSLEHRPSIEASWKAGNQESFYHYFPLLYAINESTEKLKINKVTFDISSEKEDELYIASERSELAITCSDSECEDFPVKKIWVIPRVPTEQNIHFEIYDVNYIFDLEETIGVKYFRKNVKRYSKNGNVQYSVEGDPEIAFDIVASWYQKSNRDEFTDFGYTMWLVQNYEMFPDLKARFVYLNGEPVAFSLWGVLPSGIAIHLICKDAIGQPYLQDYTRMMTYKEMVSDGLELVNDGSDCEVPGIRRYKLKLRPKYIIPIYSWERKK